MFTDMYNVYTSDQGFFLEMQFGGGKLFLWGRENRKNFQNQTKFGIVFKTPLKALIKFFVKNK